MDVPFAETLLAWHVRRKAASGLRPMNELDPTQVRRVLYVATTGLGDAILSMPVVDSVQSAWPHADSGLFVRSAWRSLFEDDPRFQTLIDYPGKWRSFFGTLNRLKAFRPDLIVVLHCNDPDILPLCYLSGAPFIIRVPWAGARFPYLLSNAHRPEDRYPEKNLHYVENRLRTLNPLGITPSAHTPTLRVNEAERHAMANRVRARLPGMRGYWLFHPHASDPYKDWPRPKARALLETMLEAETELGVVLTGGGKDRSGAAALMDGLPPGRVWNSAGELKLTQTAAVLAGGRLLVTPDTGVMHLAAALDVPTVTLLAPTRAWGIGPRSRQAQHTVIEKPLTCDPCRNKRCPYQPARCMDQIQVDEVSVAVRNLLT